MQEHVGTDFYRNGLQEFVGTEGRNDPCWFVGRRDIIHEIEHMAALMWDRDVCGLTRVIHGAPGAGKSSLLRHLMYQWDSGGLLGADFDCPTPRMLLLSASQLESNNAFYNALLGTLDPEMTRWLYEKYREPLRSLLELERRLPIKRWRRPVVVAIDDAQNIDGDGASPAGRTLQELHTNRNYGPILAVLTGLSSTADQVDRLGIPRLASRAVSTLGCFSAEESAELIEGWSMHFGLAPGAWQATVRDIAAEGGHWPVHVVNALVALAEAALANDGQGLLDMVAVKQRSLELRQNYFARAMSPEMRRSHRLVAAVMSGLGANGRRSNAADLILKAASDKPGWQLPGNMDVHDFCAHLVQRGALHQHADSSVSCPIPGFRRYMVSLGENSGTAAAPSSEEPISGA